MTEAEVKKQALEHFDTCPFNTSVTKETAHQAKELRAGKESMARILHTQTIRAANHKTNLKNTT